MLNRLPGSLSSCHWLEPVRVAKGGLKTLKTHLYRQAASDLWKYLALQGHSIHNLSFLEGRSKDTLSKNNLRGRGTWPPGPAESSEQPIHETFLRLKQQWRLGREDRWMHGPTPLGWKALPRHQRHILGVPYPRSPAILSLSHMNETHGPEVQVALGFMARPGDQSSTSPGSRPQDPPFCLRAPALQSCKPC